MRVLIAILIALMSVLMPANVQAADVWSQMRNERGLVVLMRHAIAPGVSDPAGFRLGDCSTQRVLSKEGREQARAIGKQFTSRRIPIDEVRSSRWCRAIDTATLLDLGTVRPTAALDSVFTASASVAERKKRAAEQIIRDHRGKPGVLVLVGHQANIIDLTGIAPASGAAVVVRADAQGRIRVIHELAAPTP